MNSTTIDNRYVTCDSFVFKENCLDILDKAKEYVSKLGQIEMYRSMVDTEEPPTFDENEELARQIISDSIDALRIRTQYFLEKNNLTFLLQQFNSEFSKIGKSKDTLDFDSCFEYHHSPYIDLLSIYLHAITSDIVAANEERYKNNSRRLQLEQFLQGTGKLLRDKNIVPSDEAQVRREIYSTLIHFFPDTVREIPIQHIFKTYKPDIGVRSLKAAIEYKFATNEQEAKVVIGGIFEDICGYEGSEDWQNFYAVLYMNDNYLTYPQIEAEWDISKIQKSHWKPILVIGKGERKRKEKLKQNGHLHSHKSSGKKDVAKNKTAI